FFFSSRRRHTRFSRDWSSDVCSSDLTANGQTYLIAVGPTFKTGVQDEEMQSFADLEAFVRQHFGVQSITHRWTNEDFQSMDGLPFIGCAESSHPHLYVAVGFNAWGIT